MTAEAFNKKREQIIQLLAEQLSADAVKRLHLICEDDVNSQEEIDFAMQLAVKTLKNLGVVHIESQSHGQGIVAYILEKPKSWDENQPRINFEYEKRKWVVSASLKEYFDEGISRFAGTAGDRAIEALIKKTKMLQAKVKGQ